MHGSKFERLVLEIQDRYSDPEHASTRMSGTEDTWLSPSKGEQLASSIPGAQLRWLRGAGHLVQEDAPAQLTSALKGLLADGR